MPQSQVERPMKCTALAGCTRGLLFILIAASGLFGSALLPLQCQTYQVIHNFTGVGTDGATPYSGPAFDRFGNLYGTTYLGGGFGDGIVYQLSPQGSAWTFSTLHNFTGGGDGAGPAFGSLAIRRNGALFGTTEGGANFGTAFKVRSHAGVWQETVVHRFGVGADGAQPIGGVVFDSAGNFYGTTSLGGTLGNGTVFQGTHTRHGWVESVIYNFTGGNDGASPPAGVSVDAQGNVYGTTSFGGVNGFGVVYELLRSGSGWTQTVLYSFQGENDGEYPVGGVVLDQAGNIYGATFAGGVNGGGIVYKLSPSGKNWALTTLYSFTGGFGGPYNKLTLDAQGNIYSTTNAEGAFGLGSVFKLTPGDGGWTYTDLYDFTGGGDGGSPYGSVALDAKGNIFGTAVVGGSNNQGVVFEITP